MEKARSSSGILASLFRGGKDRALKRHGTLSQTTPSQVESIARAVVMKNENLIFMTGEEGGFSKEKKHGFGLYYHDCRYLNGYEMLIGGQSPIVLGADAREGFYSVFEMTNTEMSDSAGRKLQKDSLGFTWQRVLASTPLILREALECKNFNDFEIEVPLEFRFSADFEDVFEIRGLLDVKVGRKNPPRSIPNGLNMTYEGRDGVYRSVSISFSETITELKNPYHIGYRLRLAPYESKTLNITISVQEARSAQEKLSAKGPAPHAEPVEKLNSSIGRKYEEWIQKCASVQTDRVELNDLLDRSLQDLRLLRSHIGEEEYFAAGTPWFATLFGRDTILTSIQMLPFNSSMAEQTLRLLASYQGKKVDPWKDEEPGRILHELRVGELANLGEIPHTPFYGTIDATPLFLILLGCYVKWTADTALFETLEPSVRAALEWIDTYADTEKSGYLSYRSKVGEGGRIVNQGWKDSGDAIVNADGSLAAPPITLVEVQGYAYLAKCLVADLYTSIGNRRKAHGLASEARDLFARLNKDFWNSQTSFYYLALQEKGRPVDVITSNPGHLLWSHAMEASKARSTVDMLLSSQLYSGWGIRTLSEKEHAYNPNSYHRGTVWPHDNSLIATGMRYYGFDEEAAKIFDSITTAALRFKHYRLPELFSGLEKSEHEEPFRYPVACHPQAWASGSVPYMLISMLGLVPDAQRNRLRIIRPILPRGTTRLLLERLAVGKGRLSILFKSSSDGSIQVEVLDNPTKVVVTVEPQGHFPSPLEGKASL